MILPQNPVPAAVIPARTPRYGGQKRLKRKTSRVPETGHCRPGMSDETGPIPAVGIPEKYQRECPWGDTPIYACQHCRDNGTFDPRRFNFDHRPTPEVVPEATQAPTHSRVSGPFLSDLEVGKILTDMGVELHRNPVDEAFQRGRFSRGRGQF